MRGEYAVDERGWSGFGRVGFLKDREGYIVETLKRVVFGRAQNKRCARLAANASQLQREVTRIAPLTLNRNPLRTLKSPQVTVLFNQAFS